MRAPAGSALANGADDEDTTSSSDLHIENGASPKSAKLSHSKRDGAQLVTDSGNPLFPPGGNNKSGCFSAISGVVYNFGEKAEIHGGMLGQSINSVAGPALLLTLPGGEGMQLRLGGPARTNIRVFWVFCLREATSAQAVTLRGARGLDK